MDLAEKFAL